jgi:hypothetical protein
MQCLLISSCILSWDINSNTTQCSKTYQLFIKNIQLALIPDMKDWSPPHSPSKHTVDDRKPSPPLTPAPKRTLIAPGILLAPSSSSTSAKKSALNSLTSLILSNVSPHRMTSYLSFTLAPRVLPSMPSVTVLVLTTLSLKNKNKTLSSSLQASFIQTLIRESGTLGGPWAATTRSGAMLQGCNTYSHICMYV